jgi:hypothetical protein
MTVNTMIMQIITPIRMASVFFLRSMLNDHPGIGIRYFRLIYRRVKGYFSGKSWFFTAKHVLFCLRTIQLNRMMTLNWYT